MELLLMIVHGFSGAIGGSLVSAALSSGRYRFATCTLIGTIAGFFGGHLMNLLGVGNGPFDVLTLLANVASGGLSGALVTFVVASMRVLLAK